MPTEGYCFTLLSKGVDHVAFTPESDSAPKAPEDSAAWAKTTAEQLRGWNFNSLGAWSSPQIYTASLAYSPMVDVAASAGRDVCIDGAPLETLTSRMKAVNPGLDASHTKVPVL